jgi:hypothetical protein
MELPIPKKPRKRNRVVKMEPLTDVTNPEQTMAEDTAPVMASTKEKAVSAIPDTLRKAKLISDLSTVWCNNEVKNVLIKQPNGEAVWSVFTSAIQKEIEQVMAGGDSKLESQIAQTSNEVTDIYFKLKAMNNSPLLKTLTIIMEKLGGSFEQMTPQQKQAYTQRRNQTDDEDNSDLDNIV